MRILLVHLLDLRGLNSPLEIPNHANNRKIVIGEAAGTGTDWVTIRSGTTSAGSAGTTATATNLALPAPDTSSTREIVYRIDFGAGNADTFTLINPDGTDGATSAARIWRLVRCTSPP